MASLNDKPLILQWEVLLRSLLGLKGLSTVVLIGSVLGGGLKSEFTLEDLGVNAARKHRYLWLLGMMEIRRFKSSADKITSGVEAESWIMNHSCKIKMNHESLEIIKGIMNLEKNLNESWIIG